MIRLTLCLSIGLLITGKLSEAATNPDNYVTNTSLNCGGSRFTISTHYLYSGAVSQQIVLHRHDARDKMIDLREMRIVQTAFGKSDPALNSWVEEWQCERTRKRPVLVLLYMCNMGMTNRDIDRYCTITREWVRYIDLNGNLLDKGFMREDERYRALERHLGMPDYYDGAANEETLIPVD